MNLFSLAQCINSHNNSKLDRLSLIFFLTYSNFLIILCLYFILSYILTYIKHKWPLVTCCIQWGRAITSMQLAVKKKKKKKIQCTCHVASKSSQNIEGVSSVIMHEYEKVLQHRERQWQHSGNLTSWIYQPVIFSTMGTSLNWPHDLQV